MILVIKLILVFCKIIMKDMVKAKTAAPIWRKSARSKNTLVIHLTQNSKKLYHMPSSGKRNTKIVMTSQMMHYPKSMTIEISKASILWGNLRTREHAVLATHKPSHKLFRLASI